jgi:iron complex transport system substrate-binding protein
VSSGPPRIASLLPSTTEIACALGFQDRLVGRSHECDYPAGVEHLPILTQPKLDATKSSREIDASVRALVRDGLSVYRVDAERLRELSPDVILTQDQCEVCAASLADVEAALQVWTGVRPRIVSLRPQSLGDVFVDIQRVAEELGDGERGRSLAALLANRIADVGERTGRLGHRPSVVCIEWIDPPMVAGHWMPELVTLAGGRALLGESAAASKWTTLEALAEADPDAIVVLPCGFELPTTRRELSALASQDAWRRLRAVCEGRVFLADGNALMNRPGPRLVESLEVLAEILHPELFAPQHRGRWWEQASSRGGDPTPESDA